jgi:hypothetical protein
MAKVGFIVLNGQPEDKVVPKVLLPVKDMTESQVEEEIKALKASGDLCHMSQYLLKTGAAQSYVLSWERSRTDRRAWRERDV